eukprot:gnl/Hemi2/7340_TR2498_c0_g1_i1.p1 gnl/Hemi2/7340_TR2498_c0_g1~~gnl/Hemi2/7340_TR2498_c0_g1_i1.p1  ORF type:complete len:424 (-),score=183.44 gnl/Hemi2/7340_TR2498_c0_g1_i1:130-1290(-)
MSALEAGIVDIKARVQAAHRAMAAKQQELEVLTLEMGEMEGEQKALQEQLKAQEDGVEKINQDLLAVEELAEKKKAEYEAAKKNLDIVCAELVKADKAVGKLVAEQNAVSKQIEDIEINIRKIRHQIERGQKDSKDAAKHVQSLIQQNPWIATEKQLFGKPHTDYDFAAKNPSQARTKLADLMEKQETLGKKINKKVMGMFEKAEQEYQDLVEKKKIVENDKLKIEAVIRELDEKKKEALQSTWLQVNKDFGSIFSTLLPGTNAKLDPPEGQSVLDGLEVKVAFGDVWKESLTELSGGQRSLLALSLILSLLLFKPAPMYILDEIDAALDLSHTQNIGRMLRTHFSHSQFIVVSLKEGMFNNANVLFKTRFVDGVSCVQRTVKRSN